MSMMDSSWSSQGHGQWQDHAMQSGPEDVLQQFLNMNGLEPLNDVSPFDFSNYDDASAGDHMLQDQNRHTLDTPMTGTENSMILSNTDPAGLHNQMGAMGTGVPYQSIRGNMISPPTPTGPMGDIDAQIQRLQQQKLQLEQRQAAFFAQQQRNIIPPTPTSLELVPAAHHYYTPHSQGDHTPQHHALDYRYHQPHDQQETSFTPLVSPAVTPLETIFPDTQFTVPGAYFSPLTSPALHAQSDNSNGGMGRMDGTGLLNSPSKIDFGISELSGFIGGSNTSYAGQVKKLRQPTTKRGKTGVRQSPITKPQRRKQGTTPILNEQQARGELVEAGKSSQDQQQQQLPLPALPESSYLLRGTSTESDHNSSVSPETLNDNVIDMPPPPKPKRPRSGKPSPYMGPQNNAQHMFFAGMPSPATPASLMKLSSPSNRASTGAGASLETAASDQIESFELPGPVGFYNQVENGMVVEQEDETETETEAGRRDRPLSTSERSSNQDTVHKPMPSPMPSPMFPRPIGAAPTSAAQSPQVTPGSGSLSERKTPLLGARNSKKRSSVSAMAVQVSPALRPKISPSIKPLLPSGGTADDTASLLLASKSNYQRIVEGNTLAGVSYPSELSTSLTSKRTSHKIAEQGRRNRINTAIQEMATLLPRLPPTDGKETDGEGSEKKDKNGNMPNSKAETVERAIEYIKLLIRERDEERERRIAAEAGSEASNEASNEAINEAGNKAGQEAGNEASDDANNEVTMVKE